MPRRSTSWLTSLLTLLIGTAIAAQEVAPPRVFLDKSPKAVQFQLRRLSNEKLLAIPRSTDDPKFAAVYAAILGRTGMPRHERVEAVTALTQLESQSASAVLLATLSGTNSKKTDVIEALTNLFLETSHQLTDTELRALVKSAELKHVTTALLSAVANAQGADTAWQLAANGESLAALLEGVKFVRDAGVQHALVTSIGELVESKPKPALMETSLRALALLPTAGERRFEIASRFVDTGHRDAAIAVLTSVPRDQRTPTLSEDIVQQIYSHAQSVPSNERTTNEFLAAIECANDLATLLPSEASQAWRAKLADLAVRVIRLETVVDEMRFNKSYFVVEAGEEVQVSLSNPDLMPHNLVITVPGALREIGVAASRLTPNDNTAQMYVPDSDKVLHATKMLGTNQRTKLTFEAPAKPGEYPYVCTFPNHWFRMYGVMLVVDDLSEWAANPIEPADPLGQTRRFVQRWTVNDFVNDLNQANDESNAELGARVFQEADCAKCHRIGCEGSLIGPELDEVFARHDGDRSKVLREILDPSYAIRDEFAAYSVATQDGAILSGVIKSQDSEAITIVSDAEDPQPITVRRSDIEEIEPLKTSLMPSGLMDRFRHEEVLQLLEYLHRANQRAAANK